MKITQIDKWFSKLVVILICTSSINAHACLSIDVASSDLDFYLYNPLQDSATSTNFSVTVSCLTDIAILPITLPYKIGITSILAASPNTRQMRSGSNTLDYSIRMPNNSSLEWQSLSSVASGIVSSLFTAIFSPPDQTYVGLAVIPARQNIPVGTYTDRLRIEIEF